MTLLYPYNLTLLLIVPLLYITIKKFALDIFKEFDSEVLERLLNRDRFAKFRLFGGVIALTLLIIALSRPVLEKEKREVKNSGVDIVIAIDLSASMSATDLTPSRFEVAKRKLKSFINFNSKNRYAIVGFTTNALILSPLNSDRELLYYLFDSIDLESIVSKGTEFMPILKKCEKLIKSKERVLVIFSDGGDREDFKEEIEFAKAKNIKISVLTIATDSGATLRDSNGEFLEDKSGNLVISKSNPYIEALTSATGGKLVEVTSNSNSDIKTLHREIDEIAKDRLYSKSEIYEYQELFYYFIGVATLTLFLTLFARERT